MPDRIPTPAEISTLSTAELRLLAQRLGVSQAHVDRVTEAVRRATSRLIGANLPSDALVKAVTEATDRAIRRELQAVTRDLIRQAQAREQGVEADSMLRWQSVQDDRVCMSGETLVATPDGPRTLESIRTGDVVIGASGQARRIEKTFAVPARQWCEVEFESGDVAVCTPGHRFLGTDTGWCEARELAPGVRVRRLRQADRGQVLLRSRLHGEGSRTVAPDDGVRAMRHGVQGAGAEPDSTLLLACLPHGGAVGQDVRGVRQGVHGTAHTEPTVSVLFAGVQEGHQQRDMCAVREGDHRGGTSALLGGMPPATCHGVLSDMRQDVSDSAVGRGGTPVLHDALLRGLDGPDRARGFHLRGAGEGRTGLRAAGQGLALDGGLPGAGVGDGCRGGRRLLALEAESCGGRQEEGRGHDGSGLLGDSYSGERCSEGHGGRDGCPVYVGAEDDVVVAVRRYRRKAPAFDISVETDRAYVLAGGQVVHNCEDCEARHGSVQTLAEWEADGLPGSRNTICNGNCRCELVPDDAFTGPYERERGDVQVTVDLEVG